MSLPSRAHSLTARLSNIETFQLSVAIPLNARFLAELFCLNVKSRNSNPSGVHTPSELYKLLLEVRNWTSTASPDPAAQWYKRRKAQESALKLTESTSVSVSRAAGWSISSWLWGSTPEGKCAEPANVKEVGADIVKSLRASGRSETEVAQTMWMMAVDGVGSPVTAVSGRFRPARGFITKLRLRRSLKFWTIFSQKTVRRIGPKFRHSHAKTPKSPTSDSVYTSSRRSD